MRHLHQVPLGGNERFLSFDAEANLPVLDDPPSTSIGMELAGRLDAGRHGDVVGAERIIVNHGLLQLGWPLCLASRSPSFQMGWLGATHSGVIVSLG